MQLVNEFTVRASAEKVFATLADLEQVVGCIPGAAFEGHEGADFHGRVGLRIGPVGLNLASTATVVECDHASRRLVVRGAARDRSGQGGANALVTMTVGDKVAGESHVRVVTDLDLSGRVAQFGGAAIRQVNRRILAQFIRELDALLTGVNDEVPDAADRPVPSVRPIISDGAVACPWFRGRLAQWAPPASTTIAAGALLGAVIVRALRRGVLPQPG